jgi:multiple sugar transport system substrate-binding protein
MASRALTVGFVLALAAACGGGGGGGGGDTVVRFWAFGREGELVREMVPEFEAAHPGVRVAVQQIPWTAAHEKLLTAFVGHTLPDAAPVGNTWVPEFVALGALEPLDERVGGSAAIDRGDYFAGIWDTNVVDGTVWGLPWYVDTRVIFYRTDLVAGGPWPPASWDEWREAMEGIRRRALAEGRTDAYPILLPIDEWQNPMVLALGTGAELLTPDARRGAFAEPRFRRAMEFYTGLFADGLAPPLDQSGLANLYQQFADGSFAMVLTGPWNLGEFARRLPPGMQDRWSTAPMPPPEPGDPYPGASLAGGSSLVLFAGSQHPEAAWAWLEYLSEPAQQARFYALSGDLPGRTSAWEIGGLAGQPRAAAFLDQLGHAVPTPKVPEWERIATRVAQAAEQVVRGGRDLDQTLEALDADVVRMLAKRRWLLDRAEPAGEPAGETEAESEAGEAGR